jgi:leucyl aminopeptidase
MKTELSSLAPASFETEMLVVFAVNKADKKDKKADPQIELLALDTEVTSAAAKAVSGREFAGGSCETLLLHQPSGLKAARLLIVGVAKPTMAELRKAAGAAVRFAKPRGIRSLALLLPTATDFPAINTARAVIEGAIIADYDSDTYRTDRKDRSIERVTLLAPGGAAESVYKSGLNEGVILGESQNFARVLINEPGNVLTPTEFGRRAAAMAKENGLACEVHSTDKLKELKMGAFLGVAQGSAEPPALIVLRYEPADAPKDGPVLGLVGKGITFDTGGISIKPADNMEKMKYDMAGGAAMIGAMRAIAQLKPKIRVVAVILSTENMPGGKAYKPGDVLTAMSGKTIEIINTDAEGRLVLADVLWYVAKKFKPKFMVDLATLTGAIMVALGTEYAGMFSNNDELAERLSKVGLETGERVWRMPLGPEYDKQIDSQFADMKNTGTRNGGSITAAQFLQRFVDDTPWAHLDIAGTAMGAPKSEINHSWGSGYGVRLLERLVADYYETRK